MNYGKWEDGIQAFWCGANGNEYVAWKGSHQIFAYPCDDYPNCPSHIIQHSQRIETVEDFNKAMESGIRYECIAKEDGVGAFS